MIGKRHCAFSNCYSDNMPKKKKNFRMLHRKEVKKSKEKRAS
jgi:hypothetical protein